MKNSKKKKRPPLKEGAKNDQGKLRMELIAPELLQEVAAVLTRGAEKYDDRNWEKGIKYSRVFGALQRHLWAWQAGEDIDDEWDLGHLSHAACCLMFLIAYEKRNMEDFDDRPHKTS